MIDTMARRTIKLSGYSASCRLVALLLIGTGNVESLDLDSVETSRLRRQAIVNLVNTDENSTWKATLHPQFDSYTLKDYKQLYGLLEPGPEAWTQIPLLKEPESGLMIRAIPDTFDARTVWPQCTSIKEVADQGKCGSCWAFSVTTTLQDRFCISTNGRLQPRLAPNDILACCGTRWACSGEDPCLGGKLLQAWNYLTRTGVVPEWCSPYYRTKDCKESCFPRVKYPACTEHCANGAPWLKNKWYSRGCYVVTNSDAGIQSEVMVNGPVSIGFHAYEDLDTYTGGVYEHRYGKWEGGHAVKLIGWGTEDGVPYWLMANSWGPNWGMGGFFKIRRDTFELIWPIMAGWPDLKRGQGSTD